MEIINKNGNENIVGKWVLCKKTTYVINAKRDHNLTKVHNILEQCDVLLKANDIVLKGLLGEEWAIEEQKFLARYELPSGEQLTGVLAKGDFDWIKVKTKPDACVYKAMLIPKQNECCIYGMPTDNPNEAKYTDCLGQGYRTVFEINSPNSVSDHGKGDYLVYQYNNDQSAILDLWVVDGALFEKTYQIIEE